MPQEKYYNNTNNITITKYYNKNKNLQERTYKNGKFRLNNKNKCENNWTLIKHRNVLSPFLCYFSFFALPELSFLLCAALLHHIAI